MIKKPEISTAAAASSSDINAEWAAHWNTAAKASEVRQFAIVRIDRKKNDEVWELLPPEMQILPADFIAPLEDQFDAVWRGDFCNDCGRKEFCGDPVV